MSYICTGQEEGSWRGGYLNWSQQALQPVQLDLDNNKLIKVRSLNTSVTKKLLL